LRGFFMSAYADAWYIHHMKYAAFIRGIMPANPKTRNDKLRAAFEKIGLTDVQPVISSGNVIFSSSSRSAAALEAKIEAVLRSECDFDKDVFVRSQAELEALMAKDPFKGKTHGRSTYLIVTFTKGEQREFLAAFDVTQESGQEMMKSLEKRHGKNITTRTWKTVERIVGKMKPIY
jgi:uncharacterized protein (DUF1697 family)